MKLKPFKYAENESLLKDVKERVESYLKESFNDEDITHYEGLFVVNFAGESINISVSPWHEDDVLVKVSSHIKELDDEDTDAFLEVLKLNSQVPLGAFGLTFDNTLVFSHSLPGKNLDKSELLASIQTVAAVCQTYKEKFS